MSEQGKQLTSESAAKSAQKRLFDGVYSANCGEGQQSLCDFIEYLPEATFVIDADNRILVWNCSCEMLTGVSKEEVLGLIADEEGCRDFPILKKLKDARTNTVGKDVGEERISVSAEFIIPHLQNGRSAHLQVRTAPRVTGDGLQNGAIGVIRDITVQKHIEQSLRDNEQKYRTLFEAAADAILLIRENRVVDCNSRTMSLFSVDRERIIGKPIKELLPLIRSDKHNSMKRLIDRFERTSFEAPQIFEWKFRRFNGESFWAEVSLTRLELGGETVFQAIIRNTSTRKKIEQRLAENERKYRELVEQANSIILRWGFDGSIIFLNEFGQRFFGYTEEEIIGRHVVGTIVPPTESSNRDLSQMIEDICADPKAFEQNINENIRSNGERVWISWTNRIIPDESGNPVEMLSVGTDITQKRQNEQKIEILHRKLQLHADELERRVAERTAELAIARDQAEESDRLKSAFLATMSHELRTPLNSIIGFTGILLMGMVGPLTDEQNKQLTMVQDSARHLLELINDVLDITKIEAGQVELAREPFDIVAIIMKSIEKIQPMADKKKLNLVSDIALATGRVIGDRRRMEQVLLNLLNNGVKFTETGEVRITAEDKDSKVVIQVMDTGIGIRTEDMKNLFKPFHQVDTGITRQYEGTGLGLSICKRLVESMGGTISVRSEWGVGSNFTVIVPLERIS